MQCRRTIDFIHAVDLFMSMSIYYVYLTLIHFLIVVGTILRSCEHLF